MHTHNALKAFNTDPKVLPRTFLMLLVKSCLQYVLWAQACARHLTLRHVLGMSLKGWHNLILTEPCKKLLSPCCKRKLKVGVV